MDDLAIKDVAERTGLAPGTIRMWEQRHGFPVPRRTAGGYRVYDADDVEALRRGLAFRERGLSAAAAIARARESSGPSDRPSLYAAIAASDHGARPQVLSKRTLIEVSRAIEHEALARAASPVLFGAFQREAFYDAVRPRWRALAELADASAVFAGFGAVRRPAGAPAEIPIADDDALGHEWAVIVDAPGYAACLIAWEQPGAHDAGGPADLSRRFEALWTLDPVATRRAAEVAAKLVAREDAELGGRMTALLADRPLAFDTPVPGLTALTNRVVAYLDAAAR
jgi:DICT domain-containing protein